jgi:glycosyltransferase involved in cell wall biosynthesis
MSIVIFGDSFTYPEGDAPTNRVHTYAKGLSENGVVVHVVCFENEYLDKNEGSINGIHFYYPFRQRERSKYFVIRRWWKLIKYFNTIALLRKINREDKITAIIVYTMLFTSHLFAWFLSGINNSKLIKECGEHPLRLYQMSIFKRVQGLLKLRAESYSSDGIFCISRFLIDFYKGYGVSSRKLLLVPSTVDPSRFVQTGTNPFSFPYIGYFGGLTFKRDNIDVLIKAFALICDKHPEMQLVLGGFCSEREKEKILTLIQDLKISSKVTLLKYLQRDEIIRYITHADILVMVRGNDMESQASFPSKLTEYLATEKPVVTVNVGEIADYLVDGVNSFLVEPGNCEMLAKKLDGLISDYDSALKIGKEGRQLTNTVFNYNYQAKRIIKYLETL